MGRGRDSMWCKPTVLNVFRLSVPGILIDAFFKQLLPFPAFRILEVDGRFIHHFRAEPCGLLKEGENITYLDHISSFVRFFFLLFRCATLKNEDHRQYIDTYTRPTICNIELAKLLEVYVPVRNTHESRF